MAEKFILLCGCGWKMVSDLNNTGLHELKNDTMSARKFRCPSCGFAVCPRKIKDPQAELERKKLDDRIAEENRSWLEESKKAQEQFLKETQDGEEDNPQ